MINVIDSMLSLAQYKALNISKKEILPPPPILIF